MGTIAGTDRPRESASFGVCSRYVLKHHMDHGQWLNPAEKIPGPPSSFKHEFSEGSLV